MSLEWRECPYCHHRKYCSAEASRDHIEDCDQRPKRTALPKVCPKCDWVLSKVQLTDPIQGGVASYVCGNNDCDYELTVVIGGKIQ